MTLIKAGEHPSSTAGHGEIVIDVQYLPHEKDEFGLGGHVKREVEAHLAAMCQVDPYLRKHPLRIDWILDADCAEVSADHPFVAVFQNAVSEVGLDPRLSGFGAHSDIGLPTGLGRTPTVNFGPGDPAQSISRTSASPSAILWIARRRSHSRFTTGAGGFRNCRGPARRNGYGVWAI